MLDLSHLNPYQRLLLLLLISGSSFDHLVRRCHMFIKHTEVDAVRILGQFPRFLHVVQQSDVGTPRYVLDCLPVRRVVHKLVERLFYIVMLELLSLLRVVRDVIRDVQRGIEANRTMDFFQPHSAVLRETE